MDVYLRHLPVLFNVFLHLCNLKECPNHDILPISTVPATIRQAVKAKQAKAVSVTGLLSMFPTRPNLPAPAAAFQATLDTAATDPFSQIPAPSAPPKLGAATTRPFSQNPANDIFLFST